MNGVIPKLSPGYRCSLGLLTLAWFSLSGATLASPALAQPRPPKAKAESFVFNPPPPPKDQGAPVGRRQGGASRGNCKDYGDLTALVPMENEQVRGLTTSTKPTLWVYFPAPVSADLEAEFVLQDQDNNFVYRTDLNLSTDAPGVVPITVEVPEPSLKANTRYKWTMVLYCNPLRNSASVFVTGLLESTASTSSLPKGGAAFERAAQDAKSGIWFDSLTALGELRQADPHKPEFQQAWMELLGQIGLDHLGAAPILWRQPNLL